MQIEVVDDCSTRRRPRRSRRTDSRRPRRSVPPARATSARPPTSRRASTASRVSGCTSSTATTSSGRTSTERTASASQRCPDAVMVAAQTFTMDADEQLRRHHAAAGRTTDGYLVDAGVHDRDQHPLAAASVVVAATGVRGGRRLPSRACPHERLGDVDAPRGVRSGRLGRRAAGARTDPTRRRIRIGCTARRRTSTSASAPSPCFAEYFCRQRRGRGPARRSRRRPPVTPPRSVTRCRAASTATCRGERRSRGPRSTRRSRPRPGPCEVAALAVALRRVIASTGSLRSARATEVSRKASTDSWQDGDRTGLGPQSNHRSNSWTTSSSSDVLARLFGGRRSSSAGRSRRPARRRR